MGGALAVTRSRLDELAKLVEAIPEGMVCSYSALGRAMEIPITGLLVGRMIARLDDQYPWWRVLKADGTLAIGNRDPILADKQQERLAAEGVAFVDGRVPAEFFVDEAFLAAITSFT